MFLHQLAKNEILEVLEVTKIRQTRSSHFEVLRSVIFVYVSW
jgi:hypothetical protein